MTSSAASETDRARKRISGQQDHVGLGAADALDRRVRVGGGADDGELGPQLGPQPGEEELVVVDQEHPDGAAGAPRGNAHRPSLGRGMVMVTSVPAPGSLAMATVPPWRWMRPRIESAMPWRSGGVASGSKPLPWSRT